MLVSHRHRFIYTKTVKTAGSSVEGYFERFCLPEGEWHPSERRMQTITAAGIVGQRGKGGSPTFYAHMPAVAVRAALGDEVWSRYLKFCVIRNPYEKAVSMFFFRRAKGLVRCDAGLSEAEQFEQWLADETLTTDTAMYVLDGRICMDRLLRYEHLQQDLAALCDELRLPWQPELLPRYKAGLRPVQATTAALYSARSKAVIERVYAFELEAFGYRFDGQA